MPALAFVTVRSGSESAGKICREPRHQVLEVQPQDETLAYGIGRVRDVRQGPDGYIYLAVEERGGPGRVVRLEPVERR